MLRRASEIDRLGDYHQAFRCYTIGLAHLRGVMSRTDPSLTSQWRQIDESSLRRANWIAESELHCPPLTAERLENHESVLQELFALSPSNPAAKSRQPPTETQPSRPNPTGAAGLPSNGSRPVSQPAIRVLQSGPPQPGPSGYGRSAAPAGPSSPTRVPPPAGKPAPATVYAEPPPSPAS
jgi:hypothetical protein